MNGVEGNWEAVRKRLVGERGERKRRRR